MYTNFEKEKLGKTFQYYRHKNNVKWKEINKNSYVSKNVYSKLSKGYVFDNDDYYDEFLRFFNLPYKQCSDLKKWLDDYIFRLVQSLEYHNTYEISKLHDEFYESIYEYKEYPIYEQYYICISYIFRYYYKNQYLDEYEIQSIFSLIQSGYFEKELLVYLLEVMYISNNNSIGNTEIRDAIINVIDKIDDKVLIYIKAIDEKCKGRLNSALDLFEKSCEYWKDISPYRRIKSLNGKFMIYKNIDDDKSKQTIQELLIAMNNNKLPKSLMNSINYSIGIYYFYKKSYLDSLKFLYENVVKFDGIKEMIFIGSICTHLQKELPDCFNTIDYSNSNYKQYIDYYKMKKEGRNDNDLVDYIVNVLMYEKLVHNEYAEPMWRIYEYELFEFMKKSKKHTKYYIKYKEMLDKICKYV